MNGKETIAKLESDLAKSHERIKEFKLEKVVAEKEKLQQSVDDAPYLISTKIEDNNEMHVVYKRVVRRHMSALGVYGIQGYPRHFISEHALGSFTSSDLAKQAVKHLSKKDILL